MERKYKIGDRVRIVSKWPQCDHVNCDGLMDKWLGKVMTVRSFNGFYKMEEDKSEFYDGWAWWPDLIAGLAEESTSEKIVITTDGRITKARRYTGKELTGEAVAECSPSDKFDFTTGARLAFDRLTDKNVKTLRDVVAEKSPDRVDDRYLGGVRGCPGQYAFLHDNATSGSCGKERNDEKCIACWSRPYVGPTQKPVQKQKPVQEPKFKVGDKVKIINTGKVYPTNIDWVIRHVDDTGLVARYAYNQSLGCPKNRVYPGQFKIVVIDGNMAYIKRIHSFDECCYLIGIDGLEKL